MESIKCCKCSAEIPNGSVFCMKCGAKQSIVDIEELVTLVQEKLSITNYSFSDKGKLDCQKWINEFGFDAVCEAVEIAIQQYLKFDDENNPIKHTINEVFNKIPGICANKKRNKEKPYMADVLRMVGYANKKFRLYRSLENDYKEHIERILYLYYTQYSNYSDLYEDFFWKMKSSTDRENFLEEMQVIINDLEQESHF
ncbi:MAG: zinc ribbon domain-containing protein [Bacteroidales bacterium]